MFIKLGMDEVPMALHMREGFFWRDPHWHGKNRSISSPFSKGLFQQIGRLQQQTERIAVILKHFCYFWIFIELQHPQPFQKFLDQLIKSAVRSPQVKFLLLKHNTI